AAEKLGKSFTAFAADANLQYGTASLTVLNARTGEVVFARNENVGLAPASTLKTVTLATAYQVLGGDFQYETELVYQGMIKACVLEGDLILRGTGDPSLGSDRFNETRPDVLLKRWTDAVKKAGITHVTGSVIADDSRFKGQMSPEG